MIKKCKLCGEKFKTDDKRRRFHSKKCFEKWRKGKKFGYKFPKGHKTNIGRKQTKETKIKRHLYVKGSDHQNWKGGRSILPSGYVRVNCPSHPYCSKRKWVYEHRLVMESHLGRHLLQTEVVHHINNIKEDNRIENLMLFSNDKEHQSYHKGVGRND